MEKIIVLYASRDSGKTETLKLLAEKLAESGAKLVDDRPAVGAEANDLYYTFKKGRKTICICTGGDSDDIVDEAVRYFEERECDIAICATRTKGATCERLEKFAKKHKLKPEWHDKLAVPKSLLEKMNDADAKLLLAEIL